MTETYFIDGQFPVMGHLSACHVCGRKILIEVVLNGSNHNMSVSATCSFCVAPTDEFKAQHPEIVEKIEKWRE